MKDNKKAKRQTSLIEDIVFYMVFVPLIAISCTVICQRVFEPEKIPDIFGYKIFVVLDEKMDESTKYGDLVFTKNINTEDLNIENIVAFRNNTNKVTIHKIIEITEANNVKTFTMKTASNEVGDTKYVKQDKIEGIIIHRIENVGLVILYMQNPFVILLIACIFLIIGLIIYYIAQELDKRDMAKLQTN